MGHLLSSIGQPVLLQFDWQILVQQSWNGLLDGAIYVVFALGLTLIFGVVRVINMAHGEIAMLGGMVCYVFFANVGLGYFGSAAASVVVMGASGVLLNRLAILPLLGREPTTVLLSTIGISFILLNGATAIWGSGERGVDPPLASTADVGGIFIYKPGLILLGVGAAACAGLYLFLSFTKLGKMTRATGQNLMGARLIGVDTRRIYDATVVVASALAALSGCLLLLVSVITTSTGQELLLVGFAVVIVAGMGNIGGAIAVGLGLGISAALFGQYVNTYYRSAYIYVVMILVLLVRPHGLFGRR
jgi:branched-chain amino acid transport system permease protein